MEMLSCLSVILPLELYQRMKVRWRSRLLRVGKAPKKTGKNQQLFLHIPRTLEHGRGLTRAIFGLKKFHSKRMRWPQTWTEKATL